jgi:HSP20 family molecular chaperone IbpA
MATTKPALSGKPPAVAPRIVSNAIEKEAFDQTIHRRVAERAYRLFETSNGAHGKDQEHWLQAESELLKHGLEIRESGSWLSINASLPGVSAEDVEVCLEPNRVIVHAQSGSETPEASAKVQDFTQREAFLLSELPVEIDPATASASLKDQKLTLMVKKRYPVATPSAQGNRITE